MVAANGSANAGNDKAPARPGRLSFLREPRLLCDISGGDFGLYRAWRRGELSAFNALADLEEEAMEKTGLPLIISPGRPLSEDNVSLSSCNGNCRNWILPTYEEKSQASLKMTAAEVAACVRPYVAKWNLGGITLCVVEAGIYLHFDFWHVPVRPSREPENRSRYIEAFVDLEIEMQDCEDFHFVLDDRALLTEEVIPSITGD